MSGLLFDDLEEGEIADDIVPEPIVQKKLKPLPRRYVINDKKLKSKHRKKSCKRSEHHKRKNSQTNCHTHSKPSIKHHKTCPKHNSVRHSNCHLGREEYIDDIIHRESQFSHKKVPSVKCAFKNFRSPPRKVLNKDNSKLLVTEHEHIADHYSKFKKSPNRQKKLKNISNFNDLSSSSNENQLSKALTEKNENLVSNLKCENLPIEVIDVTDDEDEEELRRIALATCLKKTSTIPEISSEDSSSKIMCSESEMHAAIDSDNYEIVDMDVDNESENLDDLFVIDTTPTYSSEINKGPSPCLFDPHSNINQVNEGVVNGFLPNIITQNTYQDFNNDVISQNLNNDLYTNIEVDNPHLPTSQMDEEFEEELLRAELIANMKSMRENSENLSNAENNLSKDVGCANDKFSNIVSKDTRVVKLKSDNCNNDRIVNIDRDNSVNEGFRDERTVSIVKDTPFAAKSRTVSSYMNPNLPSSNNLSVRKGDIKVKLNNVHSAAGSIPSIVTLPQERIIISLNNESSSDEDDDFETKEPEKNPAVASLEALISNARQESDGKKKSSNLNGTSGALSCLSKAQQEEYNSLIKILAKKKEPNLQNPQVEVVKKVAEDANLILLRKKINIAKDNYEKEKALMNTTLKELAKKKRSYLLSKLKTQQLKEQLVAAEKVRKANLQIWTKCSGEYQTLKKSVSKRQALINSLQAKISTFFPETITNGYSPSNSEQDYLLR